MFATMDGPVRYVSILGMTGRDEYKVVYSPGRFRAPEPLTAEFSTLLKTMPSRWRMEQLADAVLGAQLEVVDQPSRISRRLAASPFGELLRGYDTGRVVLQVVGPVRTEGGFEGVHAVRVDVLRYRFSPSDKSGTLESVLPPITVGNPRAGS
jgi:hypothetical protein